MKKTLLVCTHYPLPERTGMHLRTMNFVRFFKNYGPVDIVYSNVLSGERVGNPVFNNELYLQTEKGSKNLLRNLLRWINIKHRPFPISKYNKNYEKKLFSIIESEDYNYILIRYLFNTWSFFKLPGKYKKRTIVDFDDILSGSLSELDISPATGPFRKFRIKLNNKYLLDYEKKCLDFGASLFCSEKDKLKMAGENDTRNTHVVPNIYNNQLFQNYNFKDGYKNGNNLLFVGTLSYGPNVEGLKWFIESVFLDFRKEYEDATLTVVGRTPNEIIKKLCTSNAGVELCPNVSDIKGFYRKCKAVVVPLFAGGGTRIKILEASLAGRPVLSTPLGAEGLEIVNEKDILLFENIRDFFVQYKKLQIKDKYNSLVYNAKNIVLSKYSLQHFNDRMKNVLDRVS